MDNETAQILPRLERRSATHLLVDGRPFLVIGGELHNSSASSAEYMAPIWDRLVALNLNAVLAPVYWEMIEPDEGVFDFSTIDFLIEGCRAHDLKLIPLWFGTWKNTMSTYTPPWVKTNLERFARVQFPAGTRHGPISCFSDEACRADGTAFAALMRHIREVDGERQTVVMMQVENEVGMLGAPRELGPPALAAFGQPVPDELVSALRDCGPDLHPYLASAMRKTGSADGSWAGMFGAAADEVFMAWHVARFVGGVAEAGAREYALPMYANAWLVQHDEQPAGEFPSGGPVARMADVWRAAAPIIALAAPDIYIDDFAGVCADYHRPANPLFIPEARNDAGAAARAFYAFGEHDAIGFAPFGIDSVGIQTGENAIAGAAAEIVLGMRTDSSGKLLAQTYRLLRGMMPVIAERQGTGAMRGVLQNGNKPQELVFGPYRLRVEFDRKSAADAVPAGGLIIFDAPDRFIFAGFCFSVGITSADESRIKTEFIELWAGDYRAGSWRPARRLNGDDLQVRLGETPTVLKCKMFQFTIRV